MTLLIKARQNRLVAIAVKTELAKRKADQAELMFRSRRVADNLNHAPLVLQKTA